MRPSWTKSTIGPPSASGLQGSRLAATASRGTIRPCCAEATTHPPAGPPPVPGSRSATPNRVAPFSHWALRMTKPVGYRPRLPSPAVRLFAWVPGPFWRMRSSAGEHLVDIEGVTGSIPVASTILFSIGSKGWVEQGAKAPDPHFVPDTAWISAEWNSGIFRPRPGGDCPFRVITHWLFGRATGWASA